MTTKLAIQIMRGHLNSYLSLRGEARDINVYKALHESLVALCEKERHENPEPLNEDQLREMIGKPVWVQQLTNYGYSGWNIIHSIRYDKQINEIIIGFNTRSSLFLSELESMASLYAYEPNINKDQKENKNGN